MTRTVKVRVELPNDGRPIAGQYVWHGPDRAARGAEGVVVPSEAVHWDGDLQCRVCARQEFLQQDSAKVLPRSKRAAGSEGGRRTEIIAGLLPGEVIASKNSVVLEAQLLKSNLGAGAAAAGH